MKNVVHGPGEDYAVEFTNGSGSQIDSGDGHKIGVIFGVAHGDIPDGEKGVIWTEGVFKLPKPTGGGTAITQGQILDFNTGTQVTDATLAAGDLAIGYAVEAAGDNDTHVKVRLKPIRIHA